jgi:oxygen-dependent protoporphyrinogen oxidase
MTAVAPLVPPRPGPPACDVIVVGGGISGLTVAWHLHRAGADVTLLESQTQVGGAVRTAHRDGFLLEKGPFNVIVRAPEFEELLAGVATRVRVVTASDEAKNRYIYRHGRLRRVPSGLLTLFTSGLLTAGGALRALRGLLVSARGDGREVTLDEFATRRFGREVADTLVSAAIAGILAGDIRRLSAYAAFPVLEDFDRTSCTPLGRTLRRVPGMLRKRRDPAQRRRWRGLVSLDTGLGGLCDALAAELGPRVRCAHAVEAIAPVADGFRLRLRTPDAQPELYCRRLVLATPARQTAALLADHAPAAARILGALESASLTVINLAYRREHVAHPLDGFGFLVPRNEPDFPLMGVLWADSAFPHHAPASCRLLRVFMGGARTPDIIQRDPAQLVDATRRALRDVLGVNGEPLLVDLCPYADAIPQYTLGHRERVAAVRASVGVIPGLHLAGNYLEGVSINDCVKLGKKVALEVLAQRAARAAR